MTNETKTVFARVTGHVQGSLVPRMDKQRGDATLGLTGWVRNEADGAVTALFTGPAETVDAMTDRLWEGSPRSDVTDVRLKDSDAEDGLTRFEIRA